MPKPDGRRKSAPDVAGRISTPARTANLFVQTPRWLRPVDRLDYQIRRRLIPLYVEGSWSVVASPRFESSLAPGHFPGTSGSMPMRVSSTRGQGVLSEVQAAIGRYLRSEYDVMQPMPTGLIDLLTQFEQRSDESK
jgi:hypothetical protein